MPDGSKKVDMVNHPPHYGNGPDDPYEHIKVMEATLSRDEFIGAMKFTMGRYLCRLGKKDDPVQEAGKIAWYAVRLRDYLTNRAELLKAERWFTDVGESRLVEERRSDLAHHAREIPPPLFSGDSVRLMGIDYMGRVGTDGVLFWEAQVPPESERRVPRP